MSNPNVSYLSPNKIIKDFQWDSLVSASKYAHGKLLDVGCGKEPYKSIFLPRVSQYLGIDKYGNVADYKMDFLDAPIQKNSYDTILCTQVLEHTPNPQRFLNKIFRILKSNGILILTVPFTGSLHEEPNDYFRYTRYGLEYLLKLAGFKILSIRQEGNWISAIAQDQIFYLESTSNRYFFKYPKRLLQLGIQMFARLASLMPNRITKPEKSLINYVIIAKKR